MIRNTASYRDPAGHVYEDHQRIYRSISRIGRNQYEAILRQGVVVDSVESGFLISSKELKRNEWPSQIEDSCYVIEHPRIPYISYPYEWSFNQLKSAALHHLDFQLHLFKRKIILRDASAYNVQFIGSKPIFIDLLSLMPYQEGNFWLGYRQFCENFLNPLLLRSILGVAHNDWFRGRMEGITTLDLAQLIPIHKRFSWNIFSHIFLPARIEKSAIKNQAQAISKAKQVTKISKFAYEGLLYQFRNWIDKLKPRQANKTIWADYVDNHSYAENEIAKKKNFVAEFVRVIKPKMLVDLGCNIGDYSLVALKNGAHYVVGFDFDQGAVDLAFQRARDTAERSFLPLYLDASNPSPCQGWLQSEREGFSKRTKPDALVALAFIHHLAIAKNVPLVQLVQWLVSLSPHGLIEFIPKHDITITKMLELREDIFSDYNEDTFENLLKEKTKIVKKEQISKSGRMLYWYERPLTE
jgi:ribosomal protein L11 methylase PrmA